ncbi:MAG TPA: class I SAM-dependent methyltransferase [Steroidobacteraceae bacterium]|nr:class I SAM-dependent methyltransferase [Steroidobacteraceae bacterium]
MDIGQHQAADLTTYRNSAQEQNRIGDLLGLIPEPVHSALDIGARDGYISRALTTRCELVTALDLEKPKIVHDRVRCVQGNAAQLAFQNGEFDLVLCAEVLEHLPEPVLNAAARELQRVTSRCLLVGVPFEQDTRLDRTTCYTCGQLNPPWSHVGVFDANRLRRLFPEMEVVATSLVGSHKQRTNKLSALLMTKAGNPYGTYSQEEPCIQCGAKLKPPPARNLPQKVATKIAVKLNQLQAKMQAPRPIWIHMLFRKKVATHYVGQSAELSTSTIEAA